MQQNDIPLIRQQIRELVDPMFLRLREELFGSGIAYGKISASKLPPTTVTTSGDGGTDIDGLGYIKGITTYSGATIIGQEQTELEFQNLSVTTQGGKTIIVAPLLSSGQYYTRTETDLLLSVKANTGHTHTASNISDLGTAVAANAAVAANTAKITNAYHTGDVVGSGYLTIQPDAVTLDKIADSSASQGQAIIYSGGQWVVGYPATQGVYGAHAASHAIGGDDLLTPADIGAASIADLVTVSGLFVSLSGAFSGHDTRVASETVLGHVKVGAGLLVAPDGTLSASGLADPTTTTGDILYRTASGLARLPIGASGYVLQVVAGIPAWASMSTAGQVNIYSDTAQEFLGVTNIQFDNAVLSLDSGRVHIQPGIQVWQGGSSIATRAVKLVLGSGLSSSVSGNDVTLAVTASVDLAAHELVIAGAGQLGHVMVGSGLAIDEDGLLRATPSIKTETALGTLVQETAILFFGEGITATQSGTGRVVISAGQAGDFIVQSITNGVTDKAPSSDALYDYFASNPFDSRYYTKSQSDSTFATASHTHTSSQITDFLTAVAAAPAVVVNSAKVTNATHTGEVIGSGYLTIASGVITPDKLSTAGAIEGYTVIYSGGIWQYGTLAGGVAINGGTIDAGTFTTPGVTITIKRGLYADIPTLEVGEFGYATDSQALYIGTATGAVLIQDAQRIRGRAVSISSPQTGESLVWDGAQFVNGKSHADDSDKLGGVAASNYVQSSHTSQVATDSQLGHIKIGAGLTDTGSGLVTTVFSGVKQNGTSIISNPQHVNFVNDFVVTSSGSGARVVLDSALHPSGPATTTTAGHVIIGANLTVDAAGVIAAVVASGMQNPMTSAGDLIYRSDTLIEARLPIGSNGQVLTVVAGLPTWQTIAVSGGGGGDSGGEGDSGIGGLLYLWANYV